MRNDIKPEVRRNGHASALPGRLAADLVGMILVWFFLSGSGCTLREEPLPLQDSSGAPVQLEGVTILTEPMDGVQSTFVAKRLRWENRSGRIIGEGVVVRSHRIGNADVGVSVLPGQPLLPLPAGAAEAQNGIGIGEEFEVRLPVGDLEAARLEVNTLTGGVHLKGSVKVRLAGDGMASLLLECESLEGHLNQYGRIEEGIAKGHPSLVEGVMRGHARQVVYHRVLSRVVLEGEAVIEWPGVRLTGDRLEWPAGEGAALEDGSDAHLEGKIR